MNTIDFNLEQICNNLEANKILGGPERQQSRQKLKHIYTVLLQMCPR